MNKTKCYSPKVQLYTLNLELETQHEGAFQWLAICSIVPQISCIPETLRLWIKKN
jgi:hypothetical protein